MKKKSNGNNITNLKNKYTKDIKRYVNNNGNLVILFSYISTASIMLRGLIVRIFFAFPIGFFRIKPADENYNKTIIKIRSKVIIRCARILAGVIWIISMYFVIIYSGINNLNTVIAGFLITIALSQQIESAAMEVSTSHIRIFISSWNTVMYIFAKRKRGERWNEIVEEAEMLWIHPQIRYSEPLERLEGKVTEQQLMKHINKDREEMNYYKEVEDNNESKIKFANHTVEYLQNKLNIHDKIYEHQQRLGTWTYVIYLAIGTLIWLVQPF